MFQPGFRTRQGLGLPSLLCAAEALYCNSDCFCGTELLRVAPRSTDLWRLFKTVVKDGYVTLVSLASGRNCALSYRLWSAAAADAAQTGCGLLLRGLGLVCLGYQVSVEPLANQNRVTPCCCHRVAWGRGHKTAAILKSSCCAAGLLVLLNTAAAATAASAAGQDMTDPLAATADSLGV